MGIILEVALGVVLGLFVCRHSEFFFGLLLLLGLLAGAIYTWQHNPGFLLILGGFVVMWIVGNWVDGSWAAPWAASKKSKG
jgi:hypothetical protein